MGIDHAGGGVEAWIRDAPLANFAIVIGHILNEPVDCVEGIAAFVGVLLTFFNGAVRGHVGELAFAHVASTNVLGDEDVASFDEVVGGAEAGGVVVDSVGSDAVRGADHQHRVRLCRVFGCVDGGEELLAVAHGDFEFVLGVVRLDVVDAEAFGGGWRRCWARLGGEC